MPAREGREGSVCVLRRLADPGSQCDAGLGPLLAGAPDLAAAVDVTLEYLLAWDLPMPSL